MPVTEESRHELHERLRAVLGHEPATTLMEHLPPVGWADVATKDDIARLEQATKDDIARLEQATKAGIERLAHTTKHEITRLEHVTRQEIGRLEHESAMLRQEMSHRIDILDARFESAEQKVEAYGDKVRLEFHKGMNRQIFSLLGTNIAMFTLFLGAVKFL